MENGLLVALSRQTVMERQMETIANNIANSSTPGYKGEQMLFVEYLSQTESGDTVSYVQDIAVVRDYSEGDFVKTGNTFDMAIHGEGWFVVDTPDGNAYTRNGHFMLNEKGQLATTGGHTVLNDKGTPITITAGDGAIEVSTDGTISGKTGDKGRFNIVTFENQKSLQKAADSLFKTDEPSKPALKAKIIQGMVESSNVQPIVEVTNMISAMRSYESSQQYVKGDDSLLREAIEVLTKQAQ